MDTYRLYVSILQVVVTLLFIALAWPKFKDWKQYYPSVLFVMVVCLLSGVIQAHYPLWHFHQTYLTCNNLTTDLVILFTNFPPTVIAYLGRFPKRSGLVIPYFLFWVGVYAVFEYLFHFLGHITYHHGWTVGWSILVDALMFFCIRLHFSKPLLAWLVVLVFCTIVISSFHIPLFKME